MNRWAWLLIVVISFSGCALLDGLQVGTPGYYGLNQDGQCSEGCIKTPSKSDSFCDCTKYDEYWEEKGEPAP